MVRFAQSLGWTSLTGRRARFPTTVTSSCLLNCSGQGECHQDKCVCQIYYTGPSCEEPNTVYISTFGSLFGLLGLIALIQLLMCIKSDYERNSASPLRSACQVTTQKLLFFLTVVATAIRAAFFFTKWIPSAVVASNLMTAYYPVLITGFSLIVCFWAEAFHITNSSSEKPRFLSKSTLAFIAFNTLLHLILISQVAITLSDTGEHLTFTMQVFNGVFAGIMFITAIFFLAYGTEVYFKVRGAFRQPFETMDWLQLRMSRLGLVSQSTLQLLTTLFLVSYILKEIWSHSLPVFSFNFYVIGFHVAEFGVVLWFPCVLWNCKSPDQLWVLNPQKIFKNLELPENHLQKSNQSSHQNRRLSVGVDCWICYESNKAELGPMIQPCACRGDVSAVHHECLRKWLVQSSDSASPLTCKVCNEKYLVTDGETSLSRGLTCRHSLQTVLATGLFLVCPFIAYFAYRSLVSATYQALVIGTTVLVQLGSVKILGQVFKQVYKRARLASVKIDGRIVAPPDDCYNSNDKTPVLERY